MKLNTPFHSHTAVRLFCTSVCTVAFAFSLSAKPVPSNIDGGLTKLVESNLALKAAAAKGQADIVGQFDGYATEEAASYAGSAVTEAETGRIMVDVTLRGHVDFETTLAEVTSKIPSLAIMATDSQYRGVGIIEGWVSIDEVPALANVADVRGVFLSIKPELDSVIPIDPTVFSAARSIKSLRELASIGRSIPNAAPGDILRKLGTTFDQGVIQHRVDKINQFYNPNASFNYDGLGISVGALSDSYNTSGNAISASVAVTNFDLPGSPSHPLNQQPVVLLQDVPGGSDEGRGMLEIVHKMAPRARLAFATGAFGPVSFANNIRALAGLPGFTYPAATQQGFKADVIVDDLSTIGEPFYGESVIGNAIDDVAAAGVAYFSSAGNNIGTNGYESALRMVPNGTGATAGAGNTALVGTNIDLTGVPPDLYAGGFHNFNPNPGQQDVAALWNIPNGTSAQTEMQWDDPFDPADPPLDQPAIYQNTGTITSTTTSVTFSDIPAFSAVKAYFINVVATGGSFDAVVSVLDPAGNIIVSQDTGTDEQLLIGPQTDGQYRVQVDRFGSTTGTFSITINSATAGETVTTDFNLLVFRADNGAYFGTRSLFQNNIATNRPTEYGNVRSPAAGQCQFVIAKGAKGRNLPPFPTRVRIQSRGNGAAGFGPAEYVQYNAPTSKGHATAAGGNGVAAYSPFRPNIPESFTSPGPAVILFDKMGKRLAEPVIRLYPTVAAINRANTSFFGGDSASDPDTNPEFSGTSAAAPHAAALAALVLNAHSGPGSVTPMQMRSVLQRSAFQHDLDPNFSTGTARATNGGKVVVTIISDNSTNLGQGSNDLNAFQVAYVGPGSISSLTFNPNGTAAQGGNVTGGNNGYQDNAGSNPATITYFANSYPGAIFLPATRAFALGNSTGLVAADVTAPQSAAPFTGFSNLAPAPPANGTSQFRTMTIGFPTGNFSGGKILRFTVGRGAEHSSSVGNGAAFNPGPTGGTITQNPTADVFGGGVFLPDGTVVQEGMRFSGTVTGGGTFTGVIRNRIGNGYSNLDGYGVINAESAVMLPLQ